jgi:tetratricopeptide (TPR) repeat protein
MRETRNFDTQPTKLDTFIVPYEKNEQFTGRVELLQRLHDMLHDDVPNQYNHRVALYGMGGVGKTQAAVAYVYAHEDDYQRIYWITAATEASLLAGFEDIATRTGCAKHTGHSDLKSLANIVLAWLRQQQESWLVVIDNLDHIELIEGLLPYRAPGKHTLITTRNPHANGIPARGLEVPLLEISEGVEMLYALSGLESDFQTAEAENVVKELDKLPLAIETAASYVREVTRDFSAFLKDYHTRRKDLHKWLPSGNRPSQYSGSVATCWSISFALIEKQNPVAARLFQFLSFLNPDRILLEFVQEGKAALEDDLRELVSDDLEFKKALLSLERFSLLKWSRRPTEAVSIHRLLQAVMKDDLTDDILQSSMASVVNMCAIVFPAEVTSETHSRCRHYQDQVIGPLLYTTKLGTDETAKVIRDVGKFLREDGKYVDSVALLSHAVQILSKVRGSDDERTLDSINQLALAYWEQGQLDNAVALHEKTLAARMKLLGEDHPGTLNSMNNLAVTYCDQRRFEDAATLQEKTLAARRKVLGEDHPDTLSSMSNLAVTYCDQRRFEEAATLQEETLVARRKLLGEDHPDTLSSMNNLAVTYCDQRRFEDAAAVLERTLLARRKLLREDHPQTIQSMDNLGKIYHALGRQDEAVGLLKGALSMRQQRFGEKHPKTLETMFVLAEAYHITGRLNDAIHLQESALKARNMVIGKQHPDTLKTEKSLQAMLQHKRDIKDAAATAMATATFGGTMRNKPRWRQEGLIRRMISPTIFMPTMENAVALQGYGRKSGSIQYYPCEVVDY